MVRITNQPDNLTSGTSNKGSSIPEEVDVNSPKSVFVFGDKDSAVTEFESKSEPTPESETESESESESRLGTECESESKSGPGPGPGSDSESESAPETGTGTGAEIKTSKSEYESESESAPETESESESDLESAPKTESVPKTPVVPETAIIPETETATVPKAATVPESESESIFIHRARTKSDLTAEQGKVFDNLHSVTYKLLKKSDDKNGVPYTRRLIRKFSSLESAIHETKISKKGFLYFGRLKIERTELTKSQLPNKVKFLKLKLPEIRDANTRKEAKNKWKLDVLDLAIKQLNSFNMQKLKLNQEIANCSALGYLGQTGDTFPKRYASPKKTFYANFLLVALVLTGKGINAKCVNEFLDSIEIYQLHVEDIDEFDSLDTTLLHPFKKVCKGHLFVNKQHNGKNQPLIERFTGYEAEETERKKQNEVDEIDDLEDIFENIFSENIVQ